MYEPHVATRPRDFTVTLIVFIKNAYLFGIHSSLIHYYSVFILPRSTFITSKIFLYTPASSINYTDVLQNEQNLLVCVLSALSVSRPYLRHSY